jgi:tripartite ATP-independent transporter DctM subunit
MSALISAIAVLVALRVPLTFALLLGALVFILVSGNVDPVVLPQTMFAGLDSFILLSVPLFLLAGNVMSATSLTSRLTEFVASWIGHIRGGLGQVCVATNLVMAGMSGSATADTAAVSSVLVPAMRQVGYTPAFAAALNAAAGSLGPIIPPSIIMLVYASLASQSVAKLFLAGFGPGIVVAALLMAYVYWHGKRHGIANARTASWRARGVATLKALPALMMPVIILGGFIAGVFTPTEASAVAACYAILVGFVGMRELTAAKLMRVLGETAITTGAVMIVVASANVVSWLLIVNGVGAAIMSLFEPIRHLPWLVLMVINAIFLLLGLVLEPIPLMMLVVPVLLPLLRSMHVDLVQFGVIVTLSTTIALVLPPFGLSMFIAIRVAGVSVEKYAREVLPLVCALLIALLLVTQFPLLSLAATHFIH